MSQRLQSEALPVELSALAEVFNGALSRPEEAYGQLESCNADVAHELRTPLANLEDLGRVHSIVNDMLFPACAGRGEVVTGLVLTPVAQEVRKAIEFFEFVLDETRAQVALFRRAMSNLLQNAIEHSKPGARITVALREEAAVTRITVSNPGVAIGEPHLQHLFDRFYRVDAARNDGASTTATAWGWPS